MHTNRSILYARTAQELTVLWRTALSCDFVIGDFRDSRWQDVLNACRTKRMLLISTNQCDVIFCPGDARGEKRYTAREMRSAATWAELITRLLSYEQNRNRKVLVDILAALKKLGQTPRGVSMSWLSYSYGGFL